MTLYFAPINFLSNYVYRHLLFKYGADYVFSELIMIKDFEKEVKNDKLKFIKGDLDKTIFQIGVSDVKEVDLGVKLLLKHIPLVKEININMGCPQSTMKKKSICGGLLYNINLMGELAAALSLYKGFIPSAKIRLGTKPSEVLIKDYLSVLRDNGVKKVYIHARTLVYNYNKPAMYEFFVGLREEFSDMNLIFNGDIDSFQSASFVGGDLMIGRAALSNPFIFEDVKNGVSYVDGSYDPLLKDPYVIRTRQVLPNEKKILVIREYLDLAKKHDLRSKLVLKNLDYLLKGFTVGVFLKRIKHSEYVEEIILVFNEWIASFN